MSIRVLQLPGHPAGTPAAAADSAATRDFYTRVLGLTAGGATVPGNLPVGATEPYVGYAVESIASARAELARMGIAHVIAGPAESPGNERVFLRDPAGNLIELREIPRYREAPATPEALGSDYVRAVGMVMFADMRGFTPLAERREPAEVVTLLNEYFTLLTSIAISHGGTIFGPAGDCLIATFGIPVESPDAGLRAVNAAREMLARYSWLAEDWKQRLGIETGLGIGVSFGAVIAGRIGVPGYDSYTIIGDTVNVAARLSQRARAGEALIAKSIISALPGGIDDLGAIDLPPMALRGRAEPIEIACIPAPHRVDLRVPAATAT